MGLRRETFPPSYNPKPYPNSAKLHSLPWQRHQARAIEKDFSTHLFHSGELPSVSAAIASHSWARMVLVNCRLPASLQKNIGRLTQNKLAFLPAARIAAEIVSWLNGYRQDGPCWIPGMRCVAGFSETWEESPGWPCTFTFGRTGQRWTNTWPSCNRYPGCVNCCK